MSLLPQILLFMLLSTLVRSEGFSGNSQSNADIQKRGSTRNSPHFGFYSSLGQLRAISSWKWEKSKSKTDPQKHDAVKQVSISKGNCPSDQVLINGKCKSINTPTVLV